MIIELSDYEVLDGLNHHFSYEASKALRDYYYELETFLDEPIHFDPIAISWEWKEGDIDEVLDEYSTTIEYDSGMTYEDKVEALMEHTYVIEIGTSQDVLYTAF